MSPNGDWEAEMRREGIRMLHSLPPIAFQVLKRVDPTKLSEKKAKDLLQACARGKQAASWMAKAIPFTGLFPPDEAERLVDESLDMARRWFLLARSVRTAVKSAATTTLNPGELYHTTTVHKFYVK